MESISNLLKKISGISVMALVGESGTGKSFKSKLLAQKYGIDAIIDDGLLIQNDKILGGRSAKTEKTHKKKWATAHSRPFDADGPSADRRLDALRSSGFSFGRVTAVHQPTGRQLHAV